MYDVKLKQERLRSFLETLSALIEKDDVDSLFCIVKSKDEMFSTWEASGSTSELEWVGILEQCKVHFLDQLHMD